MSEFIVKFGTFGGRYQSAQGEMPQECFKSQNYNKMPKVRTNKHRRKNNRTNFTKKK